MTTGGRGTSGSREDEVLSRLYQHVTELQAAWFGTGYDLSAGLDRYETWLREHTAEDQATPDAIQASNAMAAQASAGAAAPDPGKAIIADSTTRTPCGCRRPAPRHATR